MLNTPRGTGRGSPTPPTPPPPRAPLQTWAWPAERSAAPKNEPAQHALTRTEVHDGNENSRWPASPAGETEAPASKRHVVMLSASQVLVTLPPYLNVCYYKEHELFLCLKIK